MPFKTFVAGEEALAADINTYLAKQAVATFPTAAARAAAITAPVKGQITCRDDQANYPEMWDGSAWGPVVPVPYIFTRSPGLSVPANTSADFPLVLPTTPVAGRVMVDMMAEINSGSGTFNQTLLATVHTTSNPAPASVYPGNGSLFTALSGVTLRVMAQWAGVARGTAISMVVRVSNLPAASGTVTFSKLHGIVWVAPVMSSF